MGEGMKPSEPASDPPAPPRRSTWHWHLLACFYGLAVLWGVRSAYYWEPSILALLVPLALATVMCTWTADSIARGHPIPLLGRAWLFIAAGITVLGYILWSRGWRDWSKLLQIHASGACVRSIATRQRAYQQMLVENPRGFIGAVIGAAAAIVVFPL